MHKRYNERNELSLRLKELEDKRKQLTTNIKTMNNKINDFCEYTNYQTKQEQEKAKRDAAELKRKEEEERILKGKRGIKDPNSPLKSALARKQGRSGSIKGQ